jgi:hypothetical protein
MPDYGFLLSLTNDKGRKKNIVSKSISAAVLPKKDIYVFIG